MLLPLVDPEMGLEGKEGVTPRATNALFCPDFVPVPVAEDLVLFPVTIAFKLVATLPALKHPDVQMGQSVMSKGGTVLESLLTMVALVKDFGDHVGDEGVRLEVSNGHRALGDADDLLRLGLNGPGRLGGQLVEEVVSERVLD